MHRRLLSAAVQALHSGKLYSSKLASKWPESEAGVRALRHFLCDRYLTELHLHSRAFAVASATRSDIIHGQTSVKQAIQLCCSSFGRSVGPAEASLAKRLSDNWYVTAGDVAALTEAEAAALKVPVRFLHQLKSLLDASGAPISGAEVASDTDGTAEQSMLASAPASSTNKELAQGQEIDEGTGLQAALLAAPQALAANAELPDDIMQRHCPKLSRFTHGDAAKIKVTKRKRLQAYALKKDELSPKLQEQFAAFQQFSTSRFFGQQADPIAACTAEKYADHARGILGWLHHVKDVPLQQLSFKSVIPSKKREGVILAFEYMQWLSEERNISTSTEGIVLRSLMQMAKFLYHKGSTSQPAEGDKPYGDLLVVKELRKLQNSNRKAAKVAVRASDESLKWLDWPEYLATVQELRRECAGLNYRGIKRARPAVAWSLQRYLIFAILSSIPDRQRTLRELQVGQTLFNEQGRWVIRHGPSHYKTGKAYGERPPMVLAPHIYPELEAFLDEWRSELKPQHDFVFSQANGDPLTTLGLYKLFYTSCFRITGKKTNPHLVRDSIVTHLRGSGATERELEALAIYMGHSLDMQRGTYDRRTKAAKVEPAIELLAKINQHAHQK